MTYFEYHCNESEDSAHAELWHHTHQQVTVLGVDDPGYGGTPEERAEEGQPRVYFIRFDDGYEHSAFEDELVDSEEDYYMEDYIP